MPRKQEPHALWHRRCHRFFLLNSVAVLTWRAERHLTDFSIGRRVVCNPLAGASLEQAPDPEQSGGLALQQRSRRSRVPRRALPDLNLASWFAERLNEMPQAVAEYGPLGPVYFIAMAAAAESLTFPVTPMLLTSGYIFGLPMGTAVMLVSMSCAASVQFLLSRTLLRPNIEALVSKNAKARAVNRAVEREGFRIMFLIRLEPLLPSAIANCAFGLSSASYFDFIAATLLGYVPYTFALVSSATILKDLLKEGSDKPWYLYAVGAVLYIGLLWLITDVASKAINKAIQEDPEAAEQVAEPLPGDSMQSNSVRDCAVSS